MKKNPALTLLFAWLLPGAGHWYIGQRVKGVLFCFLLIMMFTLGVLLAEGGCVDAKPLGMLRAVFGDADLGRHPYAFLLQMCEGAPAVTALVLTAGTPEPPASKLNDFGMLLTLIAGALNVLLVADALYRCGPIEMRDDELD